MRVASSDSDNPFVQAMDKAIGILKMAISLNKQGRGADQALRFAVAVVEEAIDEILPLTGDESSNDTDDFTPTVCDHPRLASQKNGWLCIDCGQLIYPGDKGDPNKA